VDEEILKQSPIKIIADDQTEAFDRSNRTTPEGKQEPSRRFLGCCAHGTNTRRKEPLQGSFFLKPLATIERNDGGKLSLLAKQPIHTSEQFAVAERSGVSSRSSLSARTLQSVFEERRVADNRIEWTMKQTIC
jgi:hypothetical protein